MLWLNQKLPWLLILQHCQRLSTDVTASDFEHTSSVLQRMYLEPTEKRGRAQLLFPTLVVRTQWTNNGINACSYQIFSPAIQGIDQQCKRSKIFSAALPEGNEDVDVLTYVGGGGRGTKLRYEPELRLPSNDDAHDRAGC